MMNLFVILVIIICVSYAHKHSRPKYLGKYSIDDPINRRNIIHYNNNNNIILSSYPQEIEDMGDVIISYYNIPNPSKKDYMIMSCGEVQSDNDYMDKVGVNGTVDGSVRFVGLVNMRCNYNFSYISYDKNNDILLKSLIVKMKNNFTLPQQGHISFTENYDEMAVIYVSTPSYLKPSTPMVRYGLKSGTYTDVVTGSSNTYKNTDMCQAPATIKSQSHWIDPGWIHTVIMKNLKSNTKYYYQYGNDEDGWSEEKYFKSRQLPNVSSTVRFIAYADMGIGAGLAAFSTAVNVQSEIDSGYDDMILHFGDISYARSIGYQWETFFQLIEPIATRVPYMIGIGNHEMDYEQGGKNDPSGGTFNGWHPDWGNFGVDSNGECGVPCFYRFKTPNNKKSNDIFWYSYDVGNVHIVQMSSEHNWMKGSKQYEWLQSDLVNVNRSLTPWVILLSHRMMYTTQSGETSDNIVSQHMKMELDDLLYKYKVNLMMSGHQHSYERSCPVYNKQCQTDGQGTVHIVVGTAGAGLEEAGFSKKLGNWSVSHTVNFGFTRITTTETSLSLQFILNKDRSIYDEVILKRW